MDSGQRYPDGGSCQLLLLSVCSWEVQLEPSWHQQELILSNELDRQVLFLKILNMLLGQYWLLVKGENILTKGSEVQLVVQTARAWLVANDSHPSYQTGHCLNENPAPYLCLASQAQRGITQRGLQLQPGLQECSLLMQ